MSAVIAVADDASDDKARIQAVKDFPDWKKTPLTAQELNRCLQDLQSGDAGTVRSTLEKLTLARPTPEARDRMYAVAQAAHKRIDDKFTFAMIAHINATWSEAESAARALQIARRSGGLRYLKRVLEQGRSTEKGTALAALGYSNDPDAAELIVEHYQANKGIAGRALAILGPQAAPATMALLQDSDWTVRKDACEILRKIGTTNEIPALESLNRDSDPLVAKAAKDAIQVIREQAADRTPSR